MEDDYKEPSVCDDCEIGDGWECQFCCSKCYEDYGECPNPDCEVTQYKSFNKLNYIFNFTMKIFTYTV